MLKLILIVFLLFAVTTVPAQTTQEEYNYVTKGYNVQISSGLDMKKGYELKDIDHVSQSGSNGKTEREAWLKALYRIPATGSKSIAAYMIIYKRDGKDNEYVCVPSPNSDAEIRDAYFKSLYPNYSDNSARLQVIAFLLSRTLKW